MVAVGTPSEMTVNVAPLLVAVPIALVTTARNDAPLSDSAAVGNVYVAAVAPGMSTSSRCHWKVSGCVPSALTLNDADWPTATVRSEGWLVIDGAVLVEANVMRLTEPATRSR